MYALTLSIVHPPTTAPKYARTPKNNRPIKKSEYLRIELANTLTQPNTYSVLYYIYAKIGRWLYVKRDVKRLEWEHICVRLFVCVCESNEM